MNAPIRRVSMVVIVMIIVLLANATYVQVFKADALRTDSRNDRILIDEFSRGVVLALRNAGASMPDDDLRLAAETHFRLAASFASTASRVIDIDDDDDAVRAYAATFLAPLIW